MVLVARDVRREYGDTVALDGVSISVDEGEVFALIGPNGAGKTTLIRSLTGTTDCEGSVELFGTPPEQMDSQRIGLLPQSFSPSGRLTARELLTYYSGLYDHTRPIEDTLDDVGMTDAADTWYEDLSGGQQRRVCVGIALAHDPDLLVLDEPTTGIDPSGRRDLWQLLDDLTAAGTTVFLTTHYMEEAEYLADRVGLLADGSLIAEGPPAELIAAHGGENRLVIEIEKSTEPAAAARAVESLGTDIETESRTVTVHGVAPRTIGDALDALDLADIAYDALSWQQPDLESVYLTLTDSDNAATTGDTDDVIDSEGDAIDSAAEVSQ